MAIRFPYKLKLHASSRPARIISPPPNAYEFSRLHDYHPMIDLRPHLDEPWVRELLSYAIGLASEAKINDVCEQYREDSELSCLGFEIDTTVVGFIGVKITTPGQGVIQHISVNSRMRCTGIARRMINHIVERYSLTNITAETDNDAVGFYRNFSSRPVGTTKNENRVTRAAY